MRTSFAFFGFVEFLVASDAAYEAGDGSGGLLLVLDPGLACEQRIACKVLIPSSLYGTWGV